MACIGEGNNAVDVETKSEAGGVCFAAPEKSAVEGFEDGTGIGGGFGGAARGSDEKSDEHTGFQAFAGDVAGDDEEAAVGGIGDDLEEVAADFEGGAIFAFDGEAREDGAGFGEDDLLDFWACLTSRARRR